MNKNPTIHITRLISHIKQQASNQRLPNATLFYGQSNRILYSIMIELTEMIHKKTIRAPNTPSDTLIEPAEDTIVIFLAQRIAHLLQPGNRLVRGLCRHTAGR